jgi:threonine dehydrogenase-like Zn-dependent dehydrogenase
VSRAWQLRGGAIAAIENEPALRGDDDVLIAVEAASLGPRALAERAEVPGLAAVGRVVATGPDARHLDGARVVVGPVQPCGDCDLCRRGAAAVCPAGRTLGVTVPGTLSERVVARARWVLPLGGDLDVPGPTAALLGHEAALAYALYARAGVGPRDPTVVLGDGPVARLLTQILAAKNAAPGGEGGGDRPRKIFACDGVDAAEALAIAGPRATVSVARPLGTVCISAEDRTEGLAAALAREVTIIGVAGAHPDLLPELAALVVRGELELATAATVVTIDGLAAALAAPARTALVVTIGDR